MMQADTITVGTMILGLIAMTLFFIKNDEFLVLVVIFFYQSGLNRYNLVMSGYERWVVVAYKKNIFNLTDELGLVALNYFFIGTAVLTISYFIISLTRKPPKQFLDTEIPLNKFLQQYQYQILIMFSIVASISYYAKVFFFRSYIQGGGGIAFGGSYYVMIGFALGGFITLMFLLILSLNNTTQLIPKIAFIGLITVIAGMTYSSSGRFQFVSWAITIGIIWVGDKNPFYKLRVYLIGGFIISLAFGLAGVTRRTDVQSLSFFQKLSLAWERNKSTEDMTMLDGFMMVLQVYPQHLNYHYGTEHLEILYRPIPRSIWPDKPLGGYANKLGLNDNMGGGSVGISQSIYGSFYGEGGVAGIYVFCFLYALLFNYIIVSSLRYRSNVRHMIKGIALSSAIPLLRGGDLPGIYAFIGMTFWPAILFVFQYKKFLRKYYMEIFIHNRNMEYIRRQKEMEIESKV